MAKRFSKSTLLAELERQYDARAKEFHEVAGRAIDAGNGWAQCEGLPVRAAVAYGRWSGLVDLIRAIRCGDIP